MLHSFFQQQNIIIGRDAFFDLLAKNKLLVRNKKRKVNTTNSKHFFYRYPNLVKDFTPLHAHELWVADITYIPLKDNRFAYLYLLTDAYSRKIVGFHVSDNMRVGSAVVALQKALDQKPADAIVIHHSEAGRMSKLTPSHPRSRVNQPSNTSRAQIPAAIASGCSFNSDRQRRTEWEEEDILKLDQSG